jgi:hypothetical protein
MAKKSMKNVSLYNQAYEAILKLFSDPSMSKEERANKLKNLIDEITDLINSLK